MPQRHRATRDSATGAGLPLLLIAAALAIAVAGCGQQVAPAPTATLTPRVTVSQATRSTSGADATAADMTATATCPAGSLMVGGGWSIERANNTQLLLVYANYPSAADAWTVNEANPQSGGAVTLTAYAVCLTANFAVTASISTVVSVGRSGTATCPDGTTLTGGGFRQKLSDGANVIAASNPVGNTWNAQLITGAVSHSLTVYAVCASSALAPAAISASVATIANNTDGEADATCKPGQTLVGGGYSFGGGAFFLSKDNRASEAGANWIVAAHNLYAPPPSGPTGGTPTPPGPMRLTAYAVCVTAA